MIYIFSPKHFNPQSATYYINTAIIVPINNDSGDKTWVTDLREIPLKALWQLLTAR